MSENAKTTQLERAERVLGKLLEAGKTLGPWQYLLEELKSIPVQFQRDYQKELDEKRIQLSVELEQLTADQMIVDRSILDKEKECEYHSLLTSAVFAEEKNRQIEFSRFTRSDISSYKVKNPWYRKYWFVIISILTVAETVMGYQMLANAISLDPARPMNLEFLAAALMTGFLFVTLKVSTPLFNRLIIRKAAIIGLMAGGLSLFCFLILTRGFIAHATESQMSGLLDMVMSVLLVFSTVILPLSGGVLIDQVLSNRWDNDDRVRSYVERVLPLIRNEENASEQLSRLMERRSTLVSTIAIKKIELGEIIKSFEQKVNSIPDRSKIESLIRSGVHQYKEGLNSFEALQISSIDQRHNLIKKIDEFEFKFLANVTGDLDDDPKNFSTWKVCSDLIQ